MPFEPTIRRAARASRPDSARARSIVIASCLAACAVLGSGCLVTPRQSARSEAPPPQLPVGAPVADGADKTQSAASTTDFHPKATDRQSFQVHVDFGRVFESHGDFDAAVLEYQNALTVIENKKRGPFQSADLALVHRRIGGALDRLGRFAQAEVHHQKALKASPRDPKVWNDAGYSYYLQGRWPDSEKALRTAIKLEPDNERIRINLGLTLAAAGKTDEAFPLLSQSSSDATGHANLGYLLAATGQFDLARRQYQTALELRPDMELARRALARLDRQHQPPDMPATANALAAGKLRSTGHPVDTEVQPTRATASKVPPPRQWSFPPGARAPAALINRVGAPAQSSNIVDLSKMPPPP
jgi:tetratricopeptide (TPR) repeat protein